MLPRLPWSVVERSRAPRAVIIVLSAVCAIVLVSAASAAAQTGTIDVFVDPATRAAPVNGTFTIQIVADCTDVGSDGLGAYEFDLVYDPDYLEVVSVADAGELAVSGRTAVEVGTMEVGPGRTAFGVYTQYEGSPQPAGPTGAVVLAVVEMRAKLAGVADLNLENVLLADTQGVGWPRDGRSLNLQGGTVTIEDGVRGDVNGDGVANSTDALIILSCDAGLDTLQFCPMGCGDVNDDGLINSTDALIVMSYDVGIAVSFPVGEPGCPSGVTPCGGCAP